MPPLLLYRYINGIEVENLRFSPFEFAFYSVIPKCDSPPLFFVVIYLQDYCFAVCNQGIWSTDWIKDNNVLSNSQVLLTNRQKCGTIYTLHKLHIFNRWRENTLVKSVFSLSSYLQRSSICVATMRGMHFFGAFLLGRTFLCADEVNVWVNIFPNRW